MEPELEYLKGDEEYNNRRERERDLMEEMRELRGEEPPELERVRDLRHDDRRVVAAAAGIEHAENHDREYRADGAYRDEAEAVVLRVAVAA